MSVSNTAAVAGKDDNGKDHGVHTSSVIRNVFQLLLCVGGIYSAYLTQGLVSEHLAVKKYGPQEERFRHLEALNGAQALAAFLLAWAILQVFYLSGRASHKDDPYWTAYWMSGITNSVGPACGMFALRNITYSAQVLAKSCKMVPVMLMGTLLHGKAYSMAEYLCMSLIGVGVALFASKGSTKVLSKLASPNASLGYGLCAVNLLFDGYTNAAQDNIHHLFPKSSPLHMMAWMNFWTASYYSIYLFALTGHGMDMIGFCMAHKDATWDVTLFCLCGAYGQLFIFYTIKTFGSLVNTLICTTRKFFNILISVVWNGNPLQGPQWTAVAMVFIGLIASTLQKGAKQQKKHKAKAL